MEEKQVLEKAVLEIFDNRPEEIETIGNQEKKLGGVYKEEKGRSVRFQVPFNPASLQLHARTVGKYKKKKGISDKAGSKKSVFKECVASEVQVSFKLIFDAVCNTDAFLYEAQTLGVSREQEKQYSVSSSIEGLLAAIQDSHTSKAALYWGSQCYKGELSYVSASYQMFNPRGNPVRGEVNITITCVDTDDGPESWERKYGKIFN